jgi:anti-sigma factor RsiW
MKMKCPIEIEEYMHEFLDHEISAEHERILRLHLQECKDCQIHFHELKRAIALVQSTSHIEAPSDFTQKVMANLPKEKKKVGVQRWFKHHPILTAASLFVVLMGGSMFTAWNEDHHFSFSKQPELVVEKDTVIVPAGKTVNGDVTVRNGNIKIEGKVNGNVTVINGDKYLASAGNVTGDIEEVNQVFEWLWYKIKDTTKKSIQFINGEKKESSSD